MSRSNPHWYSTGASGASRSMQADSSLASAAMRRVWLLETMQRVVGFIYQQDDVENSLPEIARAIYEQFSLVSVGIGVLEDGWIHYRGVASRASSARTTHSTEVEALDDRDGLDRSAKVPIRVAGDIYGVLSVAVNVDSRLTGEELETLEQIATVLGSAIERGRRLNEQSHRLDSFVRLQSILGKIQEHLDPRSAGDDVLYEIEQSFGFEQVQVGRVVDHVLHMHDTWRDAVRSMPPSSVIPVGAGIEGRAARAGRAQFVSNIVSDPDYIQLEDTTQQLICIPLWSLDEVIGVLRMASSDIKRLNDDDIEVLGVLADRFGLVLSNLRRVHEIERRGRQIEILTRMTAAIGRMVPTRAAVNDVVREIQDIWGPSSTIGLIVDGRLMFHGLEVDGSLNAPNWLRDGIPLERGVTGRVVRTGEPDFVREVGADPDYLDTGGGAATEIAIPIKVDRRVVGVLNVEAPAESPLDDFDYETLTIVAENLGIALANYDLFASEQDSRRALEAIQRVSTIVAQTLDPNEALRLMAETLAAVLRYPIVAVEVIDEDRLRLAASFGVAIGAYERQSLTTSVAGRVAAGGDVQFLPRLDANPDARPLRGDAVSGVYVPIRTGKTATGVLTVQGTPDHVLTNWDVNLLRTFAESAGVIVANTRAYEEMRNSATLDSITGVANHRLFVQQLQQEMEAARRDEKELSLLVIDIDTFKEINDRFGHIEGDRVLIEIASRLNAQLRSVDMLARYAGDEFVVILPGATMRASLEIAARLLRAIRSRPFELSHGDSVAVTLSIGAATFPADAETDEELIGAADTAMYLAKGYGRDAVCHYRDVSLLDGQEGDDDQIVRLHPS